MNSPSCMVTPTDAECVRLARIQSLATQGAFLRFLTSLPTICAAATISILLGGCSGGSAIAPKPTILQESAPFHVAGADGAFNFVRPLNLNRQSLWHSVS